MLVTTYSIIIFTFFFLSCFLSTVPASPESVILTNTFSPLRVTWTIDPPDGLVSNYTIYVTRLERGSTVVNYTSTDTQLLQFDIPNLDPYELVEVSVSASNSAGEGPSSPGVRGRTREERKLRNVSHCQCVLPMHTASDRCICFCANLHVQCQAL